jgi:hypothetical protein
MEELYYSEKLVDVQRTMRRCIPEDRILYNHCCENLKSVSVEALSTTGNRSYKYNSSTRIRRDNAHQCNAQVDTIFYTLKLVSVHKKESGEDQSVLPTACFSLSSLENSLTEQPT